MHESFVARSILDNCLAALPKDKSKITKITLSVGVMEGLEGESLRLYFRELAKGTAAAEAKIIIEKKPAELACTVCGEKSYYDGSTPLQVDCAKCRGLNHLTGGRELEIKNMETT